MRLTLVGILAPEERVDRLSGAVVGDGDGLYVCPRHPVVQDLSDGSDPWSVRWQSNIARQQAAIFQQPVVDPAQQHGAAAAGALPGTGAVLERGQPGINSHLNSLKLGSVEPDGGWVGLFRCVYVPFLRTCPGRLCATAGPVAAICSATCSVSR